MTMFSCRIECINKNTANHLYNHIRFYKSSRLIRKEFLDYFAKDLNHTIVRSSPVLPLCDPTVAFVNAGMNQFKGVLLGRNNPPASRVVNSQKCIRVGGKHNDLDNVGYDTYHHTFFEMLGNWSFGDYFKEAACEYAWKLLTGGYGINKDFLYVTYFAGDEKLGLKPDLECKDIWLRLGVSEDKLLPFGARDNFWEMGPTGPCGPSTEIHIDHTRQSTNQASRVNKGHADLTELWNIVFIQYQRLIDGPIVPLSKHHVDTGMGFERLVAVLQGKRSNYDTDLFQPLFDAIKQKSNAPEYGGKFANADKDGIDSGYRILADHARMVTVALADGMLPEQNHKLRRILRRASDISTKVFGTEGLLRELTFHVADSLGDTYSELHKNLKQVQKIIEFEEGLLKGLRDTAGEEWKRIVKTRPSLSIVSDTTGAGLTVGYKDLQAALTTLDKSTRTLPDYLAFKLYDTYGLSPDTIAELAKVESLIFDKSEFKRILDDMKQRVKGEVGRSDEDIISQASLDLLESNKVPKTDDSLKYNYRVDANGYQFQPVECKLVGMVLNGNLISETQPQAIDDNQAVLEATVVQSGNIVETDAIVDANSEVGVILDRTPFYSPEGGQASDKGRIQIDKLVFDVQGVTKIRGYVIHNGRFVIPESTKIEAELRVGNKCIASIDVKTRVGLMRHHTGTHLLNAALRAVLPAARQQGSSVSAESLTLQFSAFGEKLSLEQVASVEKLVNAAIEANVPVKTRLVDSLEFMAEDNMTLVPGEIYPDAGIRIVEASSSGLTSKEACCGTHVHSTGVLEHFCILRFKSYGTARRNIKAVVGPLARLARLAGENTMHKVLQLEKDFKARNTQLSLLNTRTQDMKRRLSESTDQVLLPYTVAQQCRVKLNELSKKIKWQERETVRNSLESEMKNAVHLSTLPFVVHCLQPNHISLHDVSLPKITSLCPSTPVLVIAHSNGSVKARCCVPKEMVSNAFNAKSWMETVLQIFKAKGGPPEGQNPTLVCHMALTKVSRTDFKSLIDKAITEATKFASLHVEKTESKNK